MVRPAAVGRLRRNAQAHCWPLGGGRGGAGERRDRYPEHGTRCRTAEPQDLRGPVFLGALALLLIDALVVFWLAGGIYRLIPRRAAAAILAAAGISVALALAGGAGPAKADSGNDTFG